MPREEESEESAWRSLSAGVSATTTTTAATTGWRLNEPYCAQGDRYSITFHTVPDANVVFGAVVGQFTDKNNVFPDRDVTMDVYNGPNQFLGLDVFSGAGFVFYTLSDSDNFTYDTLAFSTTNC